MPAENPHAHIWALDGIIAINTGGMAFSAVLGIAIALSGARSVAGESSCDSNLKLLERLLKYEAVTLVFILLSLRLANVLKVRINIYDAKDAKEAKEALDVGRQPPRVDNRTLLRWSMVGNAAVTTVTGIFLMLSLVDVFQLWFGMVSCGSRAAIQTTIIFYMVSILGIVLEFCNYVSCFLYH